jgi:endonuclease/exonuclease/phosphatase family metal-dependent hydrolase
MGWLIAVLSATAGSNPTAKVRLLDWNIDKGKNISDISRAIRDFRPDLCLLQEVDANARRTGNISVTDQLGNSLGYAARFTPTFRELAQGESAVNGQALLSKLPIRSLRAILFSAQTGFWKPQRWIPNWPVMQRRTGGRAAQVAEVDAGGTGLIVYNLHLENRGATARLGQLEETLADARQYGPDVPVVIAGDLNTQFGATAYLNAVRREGFRNCLGDKSPRTYRPIGKIDWVFVRGPVDCTDVRVHHETPGSDHFPITAVLEFKSTGRSPAGVVPLAAAPRGADADVRGLRPKSER